MSIITRMADKAGVVGTIVSTMGCAACFPAMASLGAAIGLGFLAQWEKLFVVVLIPLFAGIALFANIPGWFSHRAWHRNLLGATGPLVVLAGWYSFTRGLLAHGPARVVLYAGLTIMTAVAVWELLPSPRRACPTSSPKSDRTR